MTIDFFGKDKHFYNASIRRYTLLFGGIFNDMYIKRTTTTDSFFVKLPLKYGPGNAYEKIPQDVESREQNKVRLVVPALSIEYKGLSPDNTRKENRNMRLTHSVANVDETRNTQYNRSPYNFDFSLYAITKNVDDMLQIVEQIVPVFNPSISVQIKDIDNTFMDVEQDIRIFLKEIQMNDNWEEPEASRYIEYTFNFEIRGYLYGRTVPVDIINEIELNTIYEGDDGAEEQTIASIFDQGYNQSIKTNSEHYQILEKSLNVNIDDITNKSAGTKQSKRKKKVNN